MTLSMTVRPKVETVELFPSTEQIDGSNVITLQRLEQEDSDRSPPNDTINSNNNLSNNNVKDDEKDTETRARRKRKRILSYRDHDEEEEELQSTVKLEKTAESEEILVEGYPITQVIISLLLYIIYDNYYQEVECCQDCGASLASEWHRPPNRHDCQTMAVTTCQVMSGSVKCCQTMAVTTCQVVSGSVRYCQTMAVTTCQVGSTHLFRHEMEWKIPS